MKMKYDGNKATYNDNMPFNSYTPSQFSFTTTNQAVPQGAFLIQKTPATPFPTSAVVKKNEVEVMKTLSRDSYKSTSSKKKYYFMALVCLLLIAGAALAAFFTVGQTNESNDATPITTSPPTEIEVTESPTAEPTVSPEASPTRSPTENPTKAPTDQANVDFCSSFGVTDEEVRTTLAQEFDASFNNNNLRFELRNVECLPSSAFSQLSSAQRDVLQSVTDMFFAQCTVQLVHPDAFDDGVLFANLVRTGFLFCQLEDLPSGLYRRFNSMTDLRVNGNRFVTISNDLGAPTIEQLQIGFNPTLREFPLAMTFMPNLRLLFVQGADGLVEANGEAFVGNEDVEILFRGGTPPPVLVNLGITGLAEALNLLDSAQITNEGSPVPP